MAEETVQMFQTPQEVYRIVSICLNHHLSLMEFKRSTPALFDIFLEGAPEELFG